MLENLFHADVSVSLWRKRPPKKSLCAVSPQVLFQIGSFLGAKELAIFTSLCRKTKEVGEKELWSKFHRERKVLRKAYDEKKSAAARREHEQRESDKQRVLESRSPFIDDAKLLSFIICPLLQACFLQFRLLPSSYVSTWFLAFLPSLVPLLILFLHPYFNLYSYYQDKGNPRAFVPYLHSLSFSYLLDVFVAPFLLLTSIFYCSLLFDGFSLSFIPSRLYFPYTICCLLFYFGIILKINFWLYINEEKGKKPTVIALVYVLFVTSTLLLALQADKVFDYYSILASLLPLLLLFVLSYVTILKGTHFVSYLSMCVCTVECVSFIILFVLIAMEADEIVSGTESNYDEIFMYCWLEIGLLGFALLAVEGEWVDEIIRSFKIF